MRNSRYMCPFTNSTNLFEINYNVQNIANAYFPQIELYTEEIGLNIGQKAYKWLVVWAITTHFKYMYANLSRREQIIICTR